jgi:hypothetical protein
METKQDSSLPQGLDHSIGTPQGLDASKNIPFETATPNVIRIQTPSKGLEPNHDAIFQYCILGSFVLLILVLCLFGKYLGEAQVGLVGGGIGALAGLLKGTQSSSKRSSDDSN